MKKVILSLMMITTLVSCKKETKKDVADVKQKTAKQEVVPSSQNKLIRNINTTTSVMHWTGTKPTGKHQGTVKFTAGSLSLQGDVLKSGNFTIDLTSITNTDIQDATYKAKLENHLKSPDFFDIATYPTAKFVITNVDHKDGKLSVTGNLTIKDVTKSITIPASLSKKGKGVLFKSETFTIDRADYNVKYMSKKFFKNLKDKFIHDEIALSFEIEA